MAVNTHFEASHLKLEKTVKRAGQGSRYSFLLVLMRGVKGEKKKNTGKQNDTLLELKPVNKT